MSNPVYIAGDWGTSNLRLYLCKYEPRKGSTVLETRTGPGVAQIGGDFENEIFSLCQDWFDQYKVIGVILSGMIGSTIGWKQTPYLRCPVNILDIVDGRISFTARGIEFSILSGLKTTNLLGLPDLMRGEELQLLGWNVLHADFHGKRLFALPGTHNKWGLVQSRKVETFLSAFTGELFGLLKQHSILIAADPAKTSNDFHEVTFLQGVECAQNLGKANLLHTLFSVRSRQVLKELDTEQSVSYLSGMIIGADIKGAYQTFEGHVTEPLEVTVIGESGLSSRYLTAFKYLKIKADHALPTDVAIAGYTAIYEKIYE